MKKTLVDIIILQMCIINGSHMMYCSWDMECNGQNFLSFGKLLFYPTTTTTTTNSPKNQHFEKMRKHLEILSFYICIPKMTIIWWMVPEKLTAMDRIFCHFGQFFPFYPLNDLKNPNLEKMKQLPGDIIILHMCSINDNHMMYRSRDMEHDRQNFLWFWTNFCHFTPLTTWKFKILKKWKRTPGDITILHKCTINDNHMMYGSWDMKRERQNFEPFFALLPFEQHKKWKFWKTETNTWRHYHFTKVYHKSWSYAILFLRNGV